MHVIRLLVHFDKPVSVPRELEPILDEREPILVAKYGLLELGTFVLVPYADAALLRLCRTFWPLKADRNFF